MLKIAVCDNQAEFCRNLKRQLLENFREDVKVIVYENVLRLEEDFIGISTRLIDLLMINVKLVGVSGIDVAKRLQILDSELKVIFISSEKEKVTDIFQAAPSSFLIKPIEKTALKAAILKVMREIEEEDRNFFVITFKGKIFKIRTKDVLYFESEKRTIILHGRQENWKVYRKLDDIQKIVPDYFLRCHQSYLVNMNEIKTIRPFRIEMVQGELIPVSRPKYTETKNYFLQYTGSPNILPDRNNEEEKNDII